MSAARPEHDDDVDQLMLNARLRDELEPFLDESLEVVNTRLMPTRLENEYSGVDAGLGTGCRCCRSAAGFSPNWCCLIPISWIPSNCIDVLWETIDALHQQQIVLDFTDHLSDRELYCVIYRDILPSLEKKLERSNTFLHWQCLDVNRDPEVWLRYYATRRRNGRPGWRNSGGSCPPRKHRLIRAALPVGRSSDPPSGVAVSAETLVCRNRSAAESGSTLSPEGVLSRVQARCRDGRG